MAILLPVSQRRRPRYQPQQRRGRGPTTADKVAQGVGIAGGVINTLGGALSLADKIAQHPLVRNAVSEGDAEERFARQRAMLQNFQKEQAALVAPQPAAGAAAPTAAAVPAQGPLPGADGYTLTRPVPEPPFRPAFSPATGPPAVDAYAPTDITGSDGQRAHVARMRDEGFFGQPTETDLGQQLWARAKEMAASGGAPPTLNEDNLRELVTQFDPPTARRLAATVGAAAAAGDIRVANPDTAAKLNTFYRMAAGMRDEKGDVSVQGQLFAFEAESGVPPREADTQIITQWKNHFASGRTPFMVADLQHLAKNVKTFEGQREVLGMVRLARDAGARETTFDFMAEARAMEKVSKAFPEIKDTTDFDINKLSLIASRHKEPKPAPVRGGGGGSGGGGLSAEHQGDALKVAQLLAEMDRLTDEAQARDESIDSGSYGAAIDSLRERVVAIASATKLKGRSLERFMKAARSNKGSFDPKQTIIRARDPSEMRTLYDARGKVDAGEPLTDTDMEIMSQPGALDVMGKLPRAPEPGSVKKPPFEKGADQADTAVGRDWRLLTAEQKAYARALAANPEARDGATRTQLLLSPNQREEYDRRHGAGTADRVIRVMSAIKAQPELIPE
jgi:hypothetical protein